MKAKLVNEVKKLMEKVSCKWFVVKNKNEVNIIKEFNVKHSFKKNIYIYYIGTYKDYFCIFKPKGVHLLANILEINNNDFNIILQNHWFKNTFEPLQNTSNELYHMKVKEIKKIKKFFKELIEKTTI